ncbi:MAG: polymer-forming cytoskeletal protein [Halorhodospira halophila]|uniref:bactofilin family protein n=1 Tax=Halorhodospira TaxID=85108 RepID=UPI0019119010|nr:MULTISPECIES: polymer-forming cytoskeletal protein [Halorhodospira]MBK5944307.1 hypothetical protein [Halorhodospira halophila]MCC3750098.1 polymer-forming cytoskeletal protein [Halorhodospira halophila]MCG5527572.1 polymer-forming cytoskeletal protein [Halorhodospira halophila]MCG5532591.1 polymer-forming cytoskeletal protein [Halorhodospira sp. 9621]MCG5539015.1 polymer-forming cytoskeletal protein [Halorhodospira sp. 9622]
MGIIGKGDQSKSRSPGTTVICDGTRLVGELTLESNLHLDGQIKGTIVSDHDVSIGHTGRFEGNIKAHRLLVSGYVEGVIDCASLEIVAEGRVFGELHSDDFIIEAGGQFLGESHPRREVPLAALQHEAGRESQLTGPEQAQAPAQAETGADTEAGATPTTDTPPEPEPEPPRADPRPEPHREEAHGPAEEPEQAQGRQEQEEEEPSRNVRPQPRQTFWGRR